MRPKQCHTGASLRRMLTPARRASSYWTVTPARALVLLGAAMLAVSVFPRPGLGATEGRWSLLMPTDSTNPGSHWGQAAIYDPRRNRMIVYGGANPPDDLWELPLASPLVWHRLPVQGGSPPAREHASAVYDSTRDRMIIFGGGLADDPGSFKNDVWALSLADPPAWTQIVTAGAPPPPREKHGAVYDPVGDRMIVFGGATISTAANDLWALDLDGTATWTRLAPGGVGPSPRDGPSAIYDPLRGRMIVFDGDLDNDTWALDLTGPPFWHVIDANPRPAARMVHTAIYDRPRDRMVVFGGIGLNQVPYNDLWALSLSGTPQWQQLSLPNPPPPIYNHAAVYDPVQDRMLVKGGADLWSLSFSGEAAWTHVLPPPVPRYPESGPGAALDATTDRLVVIATNSATWALSLTGTPGWSLIASGGGPHFSSCAAYDPAGNRVFFVRGGDELGQYVTTVLELSLTNPPTWSSFQPPGELPPGRGKAMLVYDPPRDRLVLFGGYSFGDPPEDHDYAPTSDVWALPLGTSSSWEALVPPGESNLQEPSGGLYDPVHDRMLAVGGYGQGADGSIRGLWALTPGSDRPWTPLAGTSPLPGQDALLDPLRNRILTFDTYHQAWACPLVDSSSWIPLATTGTPPDARLGSFAAYDRARDRVLIYGGMRWSNMEFSNEVWSLAFGDGTQPLIVLAGARALSDRVELSWRVAAGSAATVLRRMAGEDWRALGVRGADVSGLIAWTDHEVAPGAHYDYQLALGLGVTGGEVGIDVPRAAFALEGARPNPAVGNMTVSFSLFDASPARLEVFDLAGRQVLVRDLDGLEPGPHRLDVEAGTMRPGVYLLRLVQGANTRTTRVAVLK